LGPLYNYATVEASNFKFGAQLGFGTSLPKTLLRRKLAGVWPRGASKKIATPLLIFATVAASNFKFGIQLWFGTILSKKQRLGPKLAEGACARGASEKN